MKDQGPQEEAGSETRQRGSPTTTLSDRLRHPVVVGATTPLAIFLLFLAGGSGSGFEFPRDAALGIPSLLLLIPLVLRAFARVGSERTTETGDGTSAQISTAMSIAPTPANSPELLRQQALAEIERMAAACEFATSISHDIRNSLAGMQMSLSNIASESTDVEFSERVEEIISEIARLGRRLGNVIESTRRDLEAESEFDPNSWTKELLQLIRLQIPPTIQLRTHVQEGILVRSPKQRLRLVVRNILLNSVHAIGDEKGEIELTIRRADDGTEITLEDDGPGFPEEILSQGIRLHYPSEVKKACLGLTMARRLIRDVGGEIRLSNLGEEGRPSGARVVLLLPSSQHHG